MKITRETVERMAALAKLSVDVDDGALAELARIIDYMDAVKDTEGAERPPELYDVLREDEVRLSDMPAADESVFTVPGTVK